MNTTAHNASVPVVKVSVIMPAYNAEKYIAQAIESIVNQTFTDWELIVVDDGSTDGTAAIVRSYAAKDRRIILHRNPKNLGLTTTLNNAIDLCRGEYIARMDADDVSLPERLAVQVNFLEQNPDIGFCGTALFLIDCNGRPMGEDWVMKMSPETTGARMFFHNCFVHSTIMMRRTYAQEKYDTNFIISQDYELWMRLSDITKCYIIPDKLLAYRIHQLSMTGTAPGQTSFETQTIVSKHLQKIGITADSELLTLHLAIGHQQLSPEPAFVEAAHKWLLQFWTAFETYYRSKPELTQAMRELLAKFWTAILTQQGIDKKIIRRYANSALSRRILPQSAVAKLWLKSVV